MENKLSNPEKCGSDVRVSDKAGGFAISSSRVNPKVFRSILIGYIINIIESKI